MDLKDRLVSCRMCNHKKMSVTGLVCSLTDEKPAFEEYCPDYDENSYERKSFEIQLRQTKLDEQNVITGLKYSYPTSKKLISIAGRFTDKNF